MKAIEEVLHGWADYEKIREFLKKEKGIIQISGCVDAGKAHMVYAAERCNPERTLSSDRNASDGG